MRIYMLFLLLANLINPKSSQSFKPNDILESDSKIVQKSNNDILFLRVELSSIFEKIKNFLFSESNRLDNLYVEVKQLRLALENQNENQSTYEKSTRAMQIDATTELKVLRTLNPCVDFYSSSKPKASNTRICPMAILRGNMFAIGWTHGRVRIWNWKTGEEVRILGSSGQNMSNVRLLRSLNNGNMALLRENNTIEIWNPYKGRLMHIINGMTHSTLINMGVLQDGCLVTESNQSLRIWSAETGKLFQETKLNLCQSTLNLFTNGNDLLIRSCRDRIEIFNSTSMSMLRTIPALTLSQMVSIDGRQTVAALDDSNRRLLIYDVLNGHLERHIYLNTDMEDYDINDKTTTGSLVFVLPNRILAVSSSNGVLRLWRSETGAFLKKFDQKPTDRFLTLDLLKDGNFMSVVSNGKVKIWRLETID